MASLFVTGGHGFLGRSLLPILDTGRYDSVYSLSRSRRPAAEAPAGVREIQADLCEPERYRSCLQGCDTVVHLAAATGKASSSAYRRTNVDGTKFLLAESEKAGVRNFLFVSSIAAGFPEKRHYPYARSKEAGETLVRGGRLPFTIVRPTIIVGKGSPALAGLARLARLARPVVFGTGRTMVQPIFVADLARAIGEIVSAGRFGGETLEMGGRERLSIEDLMMRIRACLDRRDAPAVHWPLAPTIALLGLLEKFLSPILPLSAGQLYPFRYDGLAAANDLFTRLAPRFRSVDQMLEESLCP